VEDEDAVAGECAEDMKGCYLYLYTYTRLRFLGAGEGWYHNAGLIFSLKFTSKDIEEM